jgi:ankyrin repeat protein
MAELKFQVVTAMKRLVAALAVAGLAGTLTACTDPWEHVDALTQVPAPPASPTASAPLTPDFFTEFPIQYATLAEAVRHGSPVQVQYYLGAGEDPEQDFGQGYRAVHVAIAGDDAAVVEVLVNHGVNLEAPARGGIRPLSLAAIAASADVVEVLLSAGADPNPSGVGANMTPLHQAGAHNNAAVVPLLVRGGGDVNAFAAVNGWTPLAHAIASDHVEVAEALLDAGASADRISRGGTGAYQWALDSRAERVIALLESRGLAN